MYRMSIVHNPLLRWGERGKGYDLGISILAIFLHYMQVRNRSDRRAFYSPVPANEDTRYSYPQEGNEKDIHLFIPHNLEVYSLVQYEEERNMACVVFCELCALFSQTDGQMG